MGVASLRADADRSFAMLDNYVSDHQFGKQLVVEQLPTMRTNKNKFGGT